MPFIENLQEFSARQQSNPLFVRERYLFPNGAQSDGAKHLEPPSDPEALVQLRHAYVTAKLDATIKWYNSDRDCVVNQAEFHGKGAGPHPDFVFPNWKARLQGLAAEIKQLTDQAEELRKQLPVDVAAQDAQPIGLSNDRQRKR